MRSRILIRVMKGATPKSTCNPIDLGILGSQPIIVFVPGHCQTLNPKP